MITYWCNWMGPINFEWIQANGNCWSAGRIDVSGIKDDMWGTSIGLPTMHKDSWNSFSKWLSTFQTTTVWTLDQLVAEYELTNEPIQWLKSNQII